MYSIKMEILSIYKMQLNLIICSNVSPLIFATESLCLFPSSLSFLDLFFWEQYYWMLVSKKFKSVQHAASVPNTSSKDKRFLADELKRLGKEMLKWGLKLETILHFATNMSELIGLSADMLAYVTVRYHFLVLFKLTRTTFTIGFGVTVSEF